MPKVLNKKDAIEIARIISRDKRVGDTDAVCESRIDKHLKWSFFYLSVSGKGFDIHDQFWRHDDGRIRDRVNFADGKLEFAIWLVDNFPDHNCVLSIKEALTIPARVSATIDDVEIRKVFKKNTRGMALITDYVSELRRAGAIG